MRFVQSQQIKDTLIQTFNRIDEYAKEEERVVPNGAQVPDEGFAYESSATAMQCTALYEALLRISDAVNAVGYTDEIFQAIVDAIPRVIHYDAASITVHEGEGLGFKLIAYSNQTREWLDEILANNRYIYSPELESILTKSKQLIVFSNIDANPISANQKVRSGFCGMMSLPIQFSETEWGVLTLKSRKQKDWTEDDISFSGLVCRFCEVLIRANRAVQDARQEALRQEEQYREQLRSEIASVLDKDIPTKKTDQLSQYKLTTRELEVFALISMGKTNQQIADMLFLSPSTEKKHVSSLFKKLGIKNRTQAVNLAKRLNLDTTKYFRQ